MGQQDIKSDKKLQNPLKKDEVQLFIQEKGMQSTLGVSVDC